MHIRLHDVQTEGLAAMSKNIQEYASALPQIYRDAICLIAKENAEDGCSVLGDLNVDGTPGELLMLACNNLKEQGIIAVDPEGCATLTPLGQEILAVLLKLPPLPSLPT